ncbi:hypothetical protein CTRI78_v000020 [Colletotrichum trifolii]|uniref:Uncharacterized protein n=1 Tax=Colletotrichum trifolii TaxID=5466 RepID=A0A4R8S1J6_COLTR|nr:hypothetical protein CTRI78_v000020 [Colletotrichum trifolii]
MYPFERELRPAVPGFSLRRDEAETPKLCSLQTCGAAADAASCDRRLAPRVLSAPDPRESPKPSYWFGPEHYRGSVDAFFRGEVAKRIYHQRGVVSLNTGHVTSNIVLFGKDPRTLVMAGFCGCVGVIVVSQAAAWMAHMYESPVLKDETAFRQSLHQLEFGAGHEQMKYGLGNLNRNVFAPDQRPVAVLFAPVVSTTGPVFQYREFMTRIDEMIERGKAQSA